MSRIIKGGTIEENQVSCNLNGFISYAHIMGLHQLLFLRNFLNIEVFGILLTQN
jgi:hypothetical protein